MTSRRFLAILALTAVGILATIALSPLLLKLLIVIYPFDWSTLSDVGQSYTGIGTIFSVLAFAGVVYSLQLQTKQNHAQQQHQARSIQIDLIKMSIEHRDLAEAMSAETGTMSSARFDAHRTNLYISMWFRYLEYAYLVGNIGEDSLRQTLSGDLFSSVNVRERWRYIEPFWKMQSASGPETDFVEIVRESCAVAEQREPPQ